MANNNQVYMPVVSVDSFHYGRVLTDTKDGITGEVPKAVPGLVEAGYNRNAQSATFFADGGPYATAVGAGEFDGSIGVADIPAGLSSGFYGDDYNSSTGELQLGDINSPDNFIQYRVEKSTGAWRYVTIYKAKFMPNEQTAQTRGGSVNFQTNGFSFKAANTVFNGKAARILDDDDPNLPEGVTPEVIAANWFTDIYWEIAAPTASEPTTPEGD